MDKSAVTDAITGQLSALNRRWEDRDHVAARVVSAGQRVRRNEIDVGNAESRPLEGFGRLELVQGTQDAKGELPVADLFRPGERFAEVADRAKTQILRRNRRAHGFCWRPGSNIQLMVDGPHSMPFPRPIGPFNHLPRNSQPRVKGSQ